MSVPQEIDLMVDNNVSNIAFLLYNYCFYSRLLYTLIKISLGEIMLNDKIKVRITSFLSLMLTNDALAFEFIKKDSSPNMNAFMNKLIPNLFYIRKQRREQIKHEIQHLKTTPYYDDLEQISISLDSVITQVFFSYEFDEPLDEELWIRPTSETLPIFDEIYHEETAITTLEMSAYIRNLLEEYARLPLYKREHLTFKKEDDLMAEAYYTDKMVSLTYDDVRYKVSMLKRMFGFMYNQSNYVLCYDPQNNVIKSFSLYKIKNPYIINQPAQVSDTVLTELDEIIDSHSFIEQETFKIKGV